MTEAFEKLQEVLYPVELRKATKGTQNIVRIDTGKVISKVSDRYQLVSNSDLLMPFLKHFGESKLVSCTPKTRSCVVEIETGRSFDFGGGDVVNERLIIQNSYDRTRRYKFMFGALRKVCLNGMYSGTMFAQFSSIHIGEVSIADVVKKVLHGYKENKFDLWKRMAKVPLTLKERLQSINKIECLEIDPEDRDPNSKYRNYAINEKVKTRAVEYLNRPESVDNRPDVFGVLNAVNRGISTELRGSYMLEKRILANTLTEKYLAKKFNLN